MDQTLRHLAENAGLNPTVRQRSVPRPLRLLHQHILRHFAERAAPPEPQRLQAWASQLGIDLDDALAHLLTVDLIEADPTTARLLGAYPFSAVPRGHRVELAGGPTVEAYCALDALGIPAMLDRDVVISSDDPQTGDPIHITVTSRKASWQPDETVVVVVADGSCGASACGRCPYITFHTSTATAQAHLQATNLAGRILTPPRGPSRRHSSIRRSPAPSRNAPSNDSSGPGVISTTGSRQATRPPADWANRRDHDPGLDGSAAETHRSPPRLGRHY